MHVETQMESGKAIRTHKVMGLVNLQEFNEILTVIYNAPEFDPKMNSLWDVREADFTAVTPQEIRALAEFVRGNWEEKKMQKAAIVVSGLFDFGITRMYEQVLGPATAGKVMIFRNLKTASDWIEGRTSSSSPQQVKQSGSGSNPPQ